MISFPKPPRAAAERIPEYYKTPHPSGKKARASLCLQVSQVRFSGKSQVHTAEDAVAGLSIKH